MGLDTTHGCWHGPYSAFTRWRNAVAVAAGYAIWNMKYSDGFTMPTIMLDWGHVPVGAVNGEWPGLPSEPLLILFTHSDCDGRIPSAYCMPLADALEVVLSNLPDDDDKLRFKTERFIEGLRKAASLGEDVMFG